jgi:hypothetical protein
MTYDKKAPFKLPPISFRCDCPARKHKDYRCKSFTVYDLGDCEFEIAEVFLNKRSVDKLLKFLLRAKVGMLTIDMKNWAEKENKCPKHGVVHKNGGYKSCPK